MKLIKVIGAVSEIWQIFIQDSSSLVGAGLTGLVFNSGSLTAYYHRDTDTTATAITLVTMTVGTFTSSGFKEIDATNMPGWYQFCPPNAALASGAKSCGFQLKGAANMAQLNIEVQLTAGFNLDTANPKVDVDTIKTNPVVNGGTITFPTTATLASTTNLTAGTVATVSGNVNGSVGFVTGAVGSVTGLTAANLDATISSRATPAQILTTALTESYAADGASGTVAQILFGIQAFLQERAVSGTTLTVKKLDGSTTAMTFTLSDATSPVSLTRAT